jgi:hypothetical protein
MESLFREMMKAEIEESMMSGPASMIFKEVIEQPLELQGLEEEAIKHATRMSGFIQ